MKKFYITATLFIISLFLPSYIKAADVSWDGGAATANWSDDLNWSTDTVPTADDDVTINTATTVNIGATTTINSLTLGQEAGGVAAILNFSYNAILNGALVIDAGNLNVYSGASITHSAGTTAIVGKVNIDIQSGVGNIQGTIDVSSKGYQSTSGPGEGVDVGGSGGAGHGGRGGSGYGSATGGGIIYGSLTAPEDYGSGGGRAGPSGVGGRGGGSIKLQVNSTLTVVGSIIADGGNYTNGSYDPGGGSGGSIYIIAGGIAGGGSITTNGGSGDGQGGGGGAGGRISLNYTDYSFSGTLSAYGGTPAGRYGGAGTIYKKQSAQENGDVILNNNDQYSFSDTYLGYTTLETGTFNSITVKNYARLVITNSTNISSSNTDWSTKGILVDNGGSFAELSGGGSLTIPATAFLYANTTRTYTGLAINGTLTHSKNMAQELYKINFTINGDTTINTGGSINVNEMGFYPVNGEGKGTTGSSSGGGGYGGRGGSGSGGKAGGITYGSLGAPTHIGSSGGNGNDPGGNGGGAIQIISSGSTIINGTISANGGNYQGGSYDPGGGSGGSVYLVSDDFDGISAITANGGLGDSQGGGGGGGGRIAMHYSTTNSHTGSVTVNGGGGWSSGQQGSILVKALNGQIISTPFDTGDPATLVYDLAWTENLGSGTDAKLQLRTAPDNSGVPGSWTDWLGPDGVGSYYTDPTGGETLHSSHSDAGNDQWVQYIVIYTANAGDEYIPTVSDITLTYVVNTAPTVTITNTPELSTEGMITASFTISDPEESTTTNYLGADIGITIGSDLTQYDTGNLTVSDAGNLPSAGIVLIDNEMLTYTGKTGNVLSGITRGVNSTTDVTHSSGSTVWYIASEAALTGDYGSQSTVGSQSIIWNPATDLNNLESNTSSLKVVANDGNLANQIGNDTVSTITLDTKVPTLSDIFLNNRTNQLTLTATDGNSILYKASNDNDLSTDGVNANSGSWVALSSPIDWSLALDPATVYVRFKDQYGNETNTISTTGPSKLSTFLIQDASNPITEEWRLFVSWPAISDPANGFDYYQIYRSTDNSTFNAYTQISTQSQNYLVDSGLDSATTYYYKATVIDDHGNESDYNDTATPGSASKSGIGLTPDGSGGGDFTAPAITEITSSSVTTTSANITWTTDELSDSSIGYSTDTEYSTETGSITMTTSHTVTLSNLTPNTKYYFRVISQDALNNKSTTEDSSIYYFDTLTDTTGPVISNIKSVVGETTAGITWSTSEESNSLVEYSLDTSYNESSSSATLVLGHAITLTGLTNNTTYNYRVVSEDANENTTTSPSYTFITSTVTASDTTAPTISNIGVSDITATGAKVSWSTNENADGKVEYGESTNYERGIAEGNHNYTLNKSVILIGLSPETTYHYRVSVVDETGNTNTSGDATFTTGAQATINSLSSSGTTSGTNAPSISSAGPIVSNITGTSVNIAWETSKKSTSQVYYKIKNSSDAPLSGGDTTYVAAHKVTLAGLTPATTYEYQVKSVDVNGNYATSSTYEFTTTLPGVNGVKIASKTESSAKIQWLTAVPTTTVVEYTNAETREIKRYTNSSMVTSHTAELTSLSPSTVYVFAILIADEFGNLARSDQYSFVTEVDTDGPIITGVNSKSTIVAGQNKVQTVLTWTTNEPTTSLAEYSLGSGRSDYDQKTQVNTDYVTNHIMVIANLKPGNVYRYKVISVDRAENKAESDPFVLLTPIKEVSALDLIIQNLEGAFGWLNKIRR